MAAFIGTLTAFTRMHSLPCILMLYLFTITCSCEAQYEYRVYCRSQEESGSSKKCNKRRKVADADNKTADKGREKDMILDLLIFRETRVFLKLMLNTGSYMSLYLYHPYIHTHTHREFACNTTTPSVADQQREDEGGPLEPSLSLSLET